MERINTSKEQTIIGLITGALSEVERKYGRGSGDGEIPKAYHNRTHSEEVLSATRDIAELALKTGRISSSDIFLAEIAASFHDIEQGLGGGQNENESAKLAEEAMRKAGIFNGEDIQKVRRMILATTVHFEGAVMEQSATGEYLTQIVADADLSSLGQKPTFYWDRAERLLKEIRGTDNPAREDEVAFTKRQLILLENHQFYTEEARGLFTHKRENIEFTQQHLESLNS